MSVGGSSNVPGVRNSGLVMCWLVVFVYFFIQVRRGVGVSAARWVYLRVGSLLGVAWSLWAVQIKSAVSCLSSFFSSSLLSPVFVCILERV